jgi:hypothetical protein
MAGINMVAVDSPAMSVMRPWRQAGVPRLLVFDVSAPSSPTAELLPVGVDGDQLTGVSEAGAGLLVAGIDRWVFAQPAPARVSLANSLIPVPYTPPEPARAELGHFVQVVEVPAAGAARLRKAIDLPGSLAAVAELGRDGFLAYTRTSEGIQASACDGWDAFHVASYAGAAGAMAADGRSLFINAGGSIGRLRLGNTGKFAAEKLPSPDWEISELRVVDQQVVASTWRRLFVASRDGQAPAASWDFAVGFDLDNVAHAGEGAWLIPMGDYGFEVRTEVRTAAP